jgi:PAS domain S-box-containing protein
MDQFLLAPLFAFNIHAFPPLLTAAAMLSLGIFVVVRERVSRVSLLSFVYTLAAGSWMLFAGIALLLRSEEATYRWMTLANMGVAAIPASLFHFTVVVLQAEERYRRAVRAVWAVSSVFLAASLFRDVLFAGFYHYSWGIFVKLRWPSYVFMVYFLLMMAATLGMYWTEYRRQGRNTTRGQRARSFLVAFSIGYFGSLDFLPAVGISYYPLSSVFMTSMLILLSRAIWRYRLVDITPAFAAQEVLENMRDALIVLDSDKVVRLVNRAACSMLGATEQDLVGRRPLDGMTDCRELAERLEGVTVSDLVHDVEVRCRSREGTDRLFSLSTSIMRDAAGAAIATVCLVNDITERRRAEAALRASEERLSRAQRMAQVGNWELDHRTGRLWWSDEVYRIYGKDPSYFRPAPDAVEKAVHPDDRGRYRAELETAVRERRPFELDYRLVRPDGAVRSVHAIGEAVRDESGRPLATSVTVQDVTEQRQANEERERLIEQLREANEKLRTLDQVKTNFITMASHELRTPLTTIKAFVELLLLKRDMPEARKLRLVGTVNEEADRLARLIGDLLDLARIESGAMKWQTEPVELGDLVRGVLAKMSLLFEKKGLRVATAFDDGSVLVTGDRDRLVQVVTNILSNAVKFTPAGGAVSVTVRREQVPRPQAVVEIADTGIGIPVQDLERIFERFHRSDDSRLVGIEGTGLGLAIARDIVTHLGGRIWAAGRGGQGSVFTFTLPLAETSAAAPVQEKQVS